MSFSLSEDTSSESSTSTASSNGWLCTFSGSWLAWPGLSCIGWVAISMEVSGGATLGGLWWGGLVVLVVLLLLAWHELGVLELLALARVELLVDLELLG